LIPLFVRSTDKALNSNIRNLLKLTWLGNLRAILNVQVRQAPDSFDGLKMSEVDTLSVEDRESRDLGVL
jgi:hypothetical protein